MASRECRAAPQQRPPTGCVPFPALTWAEGTVTTKDLRAVTPIPPPLRPGHSLATWARRHTLLAAGCWLLAAGWHVPNAVVMPAWSHAMLTHGAAHHGGSPSLNQSRGCCGGFRPPLSSQAKVLTLAPKLWLMGETPGPPGAVAAPAPPKKGMQPHTEHPAHSCGSPHTQL